MVPFSGRVALVTGANKGIGLEIARQLGGLGHSVLVGSRDASRGASAVEELRAEGSDAHLLVIDVADEASVVAAAAEVEARFGRLDVLVNNAGISLEQERTPPSATPTDRLRATFDTNVFGVAAVTNAMLPLLRRSAAPRIVNQSSGLGSLALAADPASPLQRVNLLAYNTSKAALNILTLEYAKELRDTPIKVNASNPGLCATDLTNHSGERTAAQGAVAAVRLATLPDDGPTGTFQGDDGPLPW